MVTSAFAGKSGLFHAGLEPDGPETAARQAGHGRVSSQRNSHQCERVSNLANRWTGHIDGLSRNACLVK